MKGTLPGVKACPRCGGEAFEREASATVIDAGYFREDGLFQYEPSAREVETDTGAIFRCANVDCRRDVFTNNQDRWADESNR